MLCHKTLSGTGAEHISAVSKDTLGALVGWAEGGVGVDVSTSVGPRTWLRSARNFAKTRFRRSPSIQFSAKKKQTGEIFRSRKSFFAFWAGFEASSEKRTSKSTSWQFFALDGSILSSVRPKIDKNMSVGALRSVMRRRPPHLSPTPPMRSAYRLRAA